MTTVIETLESRRFMSAGKAVIAEDLSIIHADQTRIRFDLGQIRTVAKIDLNAARAIMRAVDARIRDDENTLRRHERLTPGSVPADFARLEIDEGQLRTNLQTARMTADAAQAKLVAQLDMDRVTLKKDENQLRRDRHSSI